MHAIRYARHAEQYAHLYAMEARSRNAGLEIARAYSLGEVKGWDAGLAREAFNVVGNSSVFRPLGLDGRIYTGKKTMLWDACRKILGKDTPNYPQEVGDCFVTGTMVLMADGSEKPIEQVVAGDIVVSHRNLPRKVLRTIKKDYDGWLVTIKAKGHSDSITATPDHRFLMVPFRGEEYGHGQEYWQPLGKVLPNEIRTDRVLIPFGLDQKMRAGEYHGNRRRMRDVGRYGRAVAVAEKLWHQNGRIQVYCLEVEEDHSFIANGYAVHNCVSFGGKNATEYLQCLDILLRGVQEKWRPVFPCYYYHTSRIKIGGGRIPANKDGSLGSWLAEAVVRWGALFADEEGVPQYSGKLARQWGGVHDIGGRFYDSGKKHLVHSAALVRSWDDYVASIVNGYPCTTGSEVGYEMNASSDGFHRRGEPWGHQMCFIGVGFEPEEYAIILNNWGDVHGRLRDFDDESELPIGVLRVRRRDVEAHLRENETFAWSQFDGFPENADKLDRALFKVVGN